MFTIRKKIFLYIFSLTTLSLLVTSLVVYLLFFRTLQQNEIKYAIESSNKTKQNIEFVLQLIDNTGTAIAANNELIEVIRTKYNSSTPEYDKAQHKIGNIFQNATSVQKYIKGIHVITSKENFYTSNWGANEYELKKMYYSSIYSNSLDKEWFTGIHKFSSHILANSNVISYVRPIFDISTGDFLGILIIDINYELLREIFTISSIQNGEKVLVINNNEEKIFTYPYNIDLNDIIYNNPILLKVQQANITSKVFGKDSIIVSNTINYSDWKIIRVISLDTIYSKTNVLKTITAYIWIILLIISITASFILSSNITKPISKLNQKIKHVENGDLSINVKVNSNDELGHLSNSFNKMVVKLKALIEKVLDEEKKKSQMEFDILQAQINPHFLYNTLDSIKWLAVIQNVDNISEMTTALINLLKYNISKNTPSVTLEEEIKSIHNYVKIQKYRYGDIFNVIYNINDNTKKCKILRFILQPIVENAIFHGFENIEGNGLIKINSMITNNKLTIEIIDNGTGIDEKNLDKLNKSQISSKFSGIGIKNIEERIKLYFGKEYGIYFTSELNIGTKATLILPVIDENETTAFQNFSGI